VTEDDEGAVHAARGFSMWEWEMQVGHVTWL
jgi:hypothetical protein